MLNFNFHAPTKILFGKGEIKNLPAEILKTGKKVLLTYGGGSIKKMGLYDDITALLDKNGISFVELSGIEPNPKLTSVIKGVELCRKEKVDAILAVGGGSTIDCSKVIAAAYYYDGNPWDIILDKSKVKNALPIYSILTLAATGTEMNGNAVISNMDTNDKKAIGLQILKPVCSVLDPTYTFSVSPYQTASGVADIMSHIFEVYFSTVNGADVQDRISEGLLKVCIKYGKVALENPNDYEARANIMWASSLAINGLNSAGKSGAWSCHSMEHQLSAYYDITHGAGLATLTPAWFRYILNDNTVEKFKEYGINVWGIDASLDAYEVANKAIDMTADFLFNDLKLPRTLAEYGIEETHLDVMAQKAADEGLKYAYVPLNKDDVLEIYKSCLKA